MPTLSVAEKNHGRDRIVARIDTLIAATHARDPARFDRITLEARTRAIASLGLTETHAELEAVRAAETELARRKKHAQRAMIATLRAVPLDDVTDHQIAAHYGSDLGLPREVAEAITRRQSAHQDTLRAADEAGRVIVRLQAEKGAPPGYGLAGGFAHADQATLGQGRRVARRRADTAGAGRPGHGPG